MAVYKQKGSANWWYRFVWRGVTIRESTKQTNKAVARQMEAARKTALAKGEVGIRDRKPTPTLKDFAERDFLPFIQATFAEKRNTRRYYEVGTRALLAFERLARARLDAITGETIAAYVSKRKQDGLEVSSINRELQVLRRMFALAQEWEKTTKVLPRVRMIPGEAHRERVLATDEEQRYLDAATALGDAILEAYERALKGIRATERGEQPIKPQDPYRLRDAAMVLLDCGLRPEECFRLRWADVRDGAVQILCGKTDNARRRIPLSTRLKAIVDLRREAATSEWVFPAPTRSGHIEPSSLKKPHHKACEAAGLEPVPLYTFRHTCLTRWAASGMDPWTLAHLAGHRDMSITRRYVHPQEHTIREALERARGDAAEVQGGHSIGHSGEWGALGGLARKSVIN
jgi:integrase